MLTVFPHTRYTFYVGAYGLMEGTGFFLGIYRCQQQLGVEKSNPWYVINGTCLWLSYTVCRVLAALFFLTRMYLDITLAPDFCWHSRPFDQKFLSIVALVGYVVLATMSFIWYIKITKKFLSGVSALCAHSSHTKEK